MSGWTIADVVYLAVGFVCGLLATSRDCIDYLRRDPGLAWRMQTMEGKIAVFLVAMLVVVAWPAVFFVGGDDGNAE